LKDKISDASYRQLQQRILQNLRDDELTQPVWDGRPTANPYRSSRDSFAVKLSFLLHRILGWRSMIGVGCLWLVGFPVLAPTHDTLYFSVAAALIAIFGLRFVPG